MSNPISRRKFVKTIALVSAFPALTFSRREAFAQSPRLDPESTQARALEYTHQSPAMDKNCGNCRLFTADASSEWGPCTIFPGFNVATAGWCKAWIAKG